MEKFVSNAVSAQTSVPYIKFVECCTGKTILFSGTLSLIPGDNVYAYLGSSPLVGAGGTLEVGQCYTLTQEFSSSQITYPATPVPPVLSLRGGCTDAKCPQCNPPVGGCNCPDGYTEEDGFCVKEATTAAAYSGQLFTLKAGDKNQAYCDQGLRLYPDITSLSWPILGDGTSNSLYQLKQSNGGGPVVSPTANVQNQVWGKGTAPCNTGTTGGRLNIAGVWATGFPDNKELAFEYCITVDGKSDKQYMIGIAGDNYVKFYIDGNLAVFLNTPSGSVTTPFRHWHTFPITLSPGTHTIKLAGLNFGSSAAFAAEIYNTTLANFQANLMNPAVSATNCGSTPAQLQQYIIFSTKDMVGKQVANPNQPGDWTCPDGGDVDFCNGTPSCTSVEKFKPACACYMVIPCDGSDTFVTNNEKFEDYIDTFQIVDTKNYSGCAYITKLADTACLDAVDAEIGSETPCDCGLKCYYVSNTNGFLYVDENDELQEVSSLDAKPYVKICSKVYPVEANNSTNFQIINLGDCGVDGCPKVCFKLTSCDPNSDEVIYSNSDSLFQYVYGTNNIVKINGRSGCWEVSLPTGDCDCLVVTTTSLNPNYFTPFTATANAIGTYNGNNLYGFTFEGTQYYIWYNEKDQWIFSFDGYGDNNNFELIAVTTETQETCPVSIDDSIIWRSRREGVDTTTELCPAECDCPIDVTVTSSYETCLDCIGYVAYKLTSCTNNDVIYTLNDLSQYVDQVVKIDCGCYTVEEVNFLPPNTQTVVVEDVYTKCIECTRSYWKLTDCADDQNIIITYSDLSTYDGKVIKIENCTECWEVEFTTEHLNATTVTVTNEYEDCLECGIPTVCECTKITNLNTKEKTYFYYDCDNILQQIKLKSGESSEKVCALEWITEIPYCECIQFKVKGQTLYAFIIPDTFENDRPVYNLCDEQFDCGTVYWDGFNWVIEASDGYITWILPESTSTLCPYGDWEEYQQVKPREKAAAAAILTSQPCENIQACDCFTLTTSDGEVFTFYPYSIDINGNPIYINSEGQLITYNLKNFCWSFNIFQDFNYFLCQDLYTPCPIGNWSTPYGINTAVTVLCPPKNNDFTVYDHFETFGECKNGVCPPPVFKNNRTVRPGYNTPNCNPDEYDKITCKFGQVMYKVVLEKRYGITNCCPDEDDKWILKKELIDLQALKDPNYNCPECSCSCNSGKTYSSCNCGN